MVINILDVKPGLKISGLHLESSLCLLKDYPFTWGTPWEITKVEFTHTSEAHEYQGQQYPSRMHFRVHAKSAEGVEQSVGTLSDIEGVIASVFS